MTTRLAVFSDIHGNAAGVVATLEHARLHNCSDFICLGDVADGGEEGDACARLLQEQCIPVVRGNHDEECVVDVLPETRAWLKALPEEHRIGDILFTHISPCGSGRGIKNQYRAGSVFDDHDSFRILFVGHLHYPVVFSEKSDMPMEAALPQWHYGEPLALDRDDRHIICPGSIGYPRDGMRQLRYAIFDTERWELTMMRFKGPLLDFGT